MIRKFTSEEFCLRSTYVRKMRITEYYVVPVMEVPRTPYNYVEHWPVNKWCPIVGICKV